MPDSVADCTPGFEAGKVSEPALAIEWEAPVLEDIRRRAVDGFNRFGHGGLQVGGVLYGVQEPGAIRILRCTEIACEHARGPGFLLSANDEAALALQLAAHQELTPVGWYCSHTRSGIELTAADRELYQRFFPEAWQVALVVQPTRWGPAEAGFHVRQADGSVNDSPVQRLTLEPPRVPRAVSSSVETIEEPAPPAAPAKVTPARPASFRFRPGRWFWAVAASLMTLAASAAMFEIMVHRPPPRVGLRTFELAGQLRIEWDQRALAGLQASSGTLEIDDGGVPTVIRLDARQLQSSGITYVPHSGDVQVRLRIASDRAGGGNLEELTRFIRPIRPSAETPASAAALPSTSQSEGIGKALPGGADRMPATAQSAREPPATTVRPLSLPSDPQAETVAPAEILPSAPAFYDPPPKSPSLPLTLAIPQAPSGYQGPRSGRLLWTGELPRRGVVEIDGQHASIGSLSGHLPGVPVSLQIEPAELGPAGLVVYSSEAAAESRQESPGRGNGWNATRFEWNPERVRELTVLEAPNVSNGFRRLVLRSDIRSYPVIIVEWKLR
jgi:proteasome lid subunit RPN8/RPN11